MTTSPFALMDAGEVNRRILAKAKEESRADYSRVEAASIKRKTQLSSPEAKRLLGRAFYSFQVNINRISGLARTKLPEEAVASVEEMVRQKLDAATKNINRRIDATGELLKRVGITKVATYDVMMLEEEVSIISPLSRRYFELIHKYDQLMPILQTLEIEEVADVRTVRSWRSNAKFAVLSVAGTVRYLSLGIRNRMYAVQAAEDAERAPQSQPAPVGATGPEGGADVQISAPAAAPTQALALDVTASGLDEGSTDGTASSDQAEVGVEKKRGKRASAEAPQHAGPAAVEPTA